MIFNTAKVMPKGQITLPVDIRKNMGIRTGDSVALIYDKGRVIMMNPAIYAMETLQKEMMGEAEKAGLHSDEDVIDMVMTMRAENEE
jgi:AbrB family looped-hinge helix DNA binding protein